MSSPQQTHPILTVRDLDASRAFYQTVFKAAVTWDEAAATVHFPGGATIKLVADTPAPGRSFNAAAWIGPADARQQHILLPLTVPSLPAWRDLLNVADVPVESWRPASDATTVRLRDLDGHLLEFDARERPAPADRPHQPLFSHDRETNTPGTRQLRSTAAEILIQL